MRRFNDRFTFLLADVLLLNAAVFLALLVRFEGSPPAAFTSEYEKVMIPFTVLSLAAFHYAGLYSSLWRYASVDDAFTILKGTTLSSLALALLIYGLPTMAGSFQWAQPFMVRAFPRSVVVLTWLLNTMLAGGLRFSIRYSQRATLQWHRRLPWRWREASWSTTRNNRILVVGAGDAGSLVAKELAKHRELGYDAVGFIDDDPAKQGLKIHGVPVLGALTDLPALVTRLNVGEVIIAMPSAEGKTIRRVVASIERLPVRVKTLPGMFELLNGRVTISDIREVQIDDLLGRQPVAANLQEIAGYLSGERILVTGAGGSIGSELCRQVASFHPLELVILDNSENGVFETALDLRRRFPNLNVREIVADIRDEAKLFHTFEWAHPDVVFHAAAHKHVPLMEQHPDEAIKTNIFGTKNVAEAALRHHAKRFVLISTDKAVNPSSVMGATKRVAEMVVQTLDAQRRQLDPTATRFVAVRFGNVLGSRGSVIPVFKAQIARGGPVTVTHPEMRRYFMTIPEAVQLVIQAGAMGQGGEIFVLDMGEPVRILDLAENLIRLSGFTPGEDIPIVITGPRPGEKLFEELLTTEEGTLATAHERIFIGKIRPVDPVWLEDHLAALSKSVTVFGPQTGDVVSALRETVPNYHPAWWEETAAAKERA